MIATLSGAGQLENVETRTEIVPRLYAEGGHFTQSPTGGPVLVYLSRLAPGSIRTVAKALNSIAKIRPEGGGALIALKAAELAS